MTVPSWIAPLGWTITGALGVRRLPTETIWAETSCNQEVPICGQGFVDPEVLDAAFGEGDGDVEGGGLTGGQGGGGLIGDGGRRSGSRFGRRCWPRRGELGPPRRLPPPLEAA